MTNDDFVILAGNPPFTAPTLPPLALTPTAWLAAIPGVLAQLEPHERVSFVVEALQMADKSGVEVAGCAVDCINSMIYWK